jgi:hypothetical protein
MDQQVALKPQEKKGFWEKMSFSQKLLIGVGVLLIIVVVIAMILGGIDNFYQFFFYIVVIAVVIGGLYFVIQMANILFQPKYYSPREDLRTKLLNSAVDYKPDNVRDLYFIGDVGKKRVRAGKIAGLLGLPYYMGEPLTYEVDCIDKNKVPHKAGDTVFSEIKDYEGKKVPVFKNIERATGGDTLFIIKTGFFLFEKTHFIRCRFDLHSTLNGDVEIYDINPVPYGFFEYPFRMIQAEPSRIMVQNQIETIMMTHEHQHDLISQSVDSAIYFNPYMNLQIKQQAELSQEGQ